jgi:hypothetical protein
MPSVLTASVVAPPKNYGLREFSLSSRLWLCKCCKAVIPWSPTMLKQKEKVLHSVAFKLQYVVSQKVNMILIKET